MELSKFEDNLEFEQHYSATFLLLEQTYRTHTSDKSQNSS